MTLEWSFIICKCHRHLRRGHPLCFRVDVDHRNGCVRHVVPVHTLVRGAVAAEHRLTNGEALWQVRQCYDAAVLAPHLCLVIIATCRRATSRRRRGRWRRRRRGRCRWRRRGRRGHHQRQQWIPSCLWHQGLYLRHRSLVCCDASFESSIWHGTRLTRWSLLATSIISRLNSYHRRVDSGRQRQVAARRPQSPDPENAQGSGSRVMYAP